MSVVHGALDHAELAALGLRAATIKDFSSNLNPFGPPPSVRAALATLDVAPYPDRSCLALRRSLAERHDCAPEQILAGNGSIELIYLIARALLRPADTALVVEPTFGEYRYASELAGAQIISWRADAAAGFSIDVAAIQALIQRSMPRLVWLCLPNNPTGASLAAAEVAQLADSCRAAGGYLVLDRAYAEFEQTPAWREPLASRHMLHLYSLTKAYALAGLRLGYLRADSALISQIARYQPAWSVNSAAQAAGLAAVQDRDFLASTIPQVWQCSDQLRAGLRELGLFVTAADVPFCLVRTGDGARTRTQLLRQGFVVRDCASFGLHQYVRVAPRTSAENQALLDAWRAIMQS